MNIKVSIIIPVYNVAPFLDACLSSCINQTFQDLEIVVVNDGSTDESPLIIQRYVEKDDRIKVITKENQGLIYARKSGLEKARGEYIFHLDGDDYLEISAISELYDKAIKSGADYVIANYYKVCDNNRQKMQSMNELNGLYGQELLSSIFICGEWWIWGKLMQKSLFDNIIYCPIAMGEDLFFNMQICLKVKKAIVVDSCLYNYVFRSGSITNQNKRISMKLEIDMAKSIIYLLDIYPYNKSIKEKIYLKFYCLFLDCMSNKEMSIKNILYDYYWNKKEVRDFLWKKRKDFYLIINVFFRYPAIASIMAKIYLFLIDFRRSMKRFKYELINK